MGFFSPLSVFLFLMVVCFVLLNGEGICLVNLYQILYMIPISDVS